MTSKKGRVRWGGPVNPPVAELTEHEIHRALYTADGRLTQAAALLGIHRGTLWKRMRQLGLSTERKTLIRSTTAPPAANE